MKHIVLIFILSLIPLNSLAIQKPLKTVSYDPYCAAMALNADSGEVYFEKNADTPAYPASILKMMMLLITLEAVENGQIKLTDTVQITQEAVETEGSQIYLDPTEEFSVEDLLYALMVQSANDAAMALAIHVAGSKTKFILLMNEKAKALGMKNSSFHSVHGLPPSTGQAADTTTARDLSLLSLALVKNPQTFQFTGTTEQEFRDGQFIMHTRNHLLENLDGCDGLKTGYFQAAGFSTVTTAARDGKRMIAIVLGSTDRKTRDAKAKELIEQGFAKFSPKSVQNITENTQETTTPQQPVDTTAVQILEATTLTSEAEENTPVEKTQPKAPVSSVIDWKIFFYGLFLGIVLTLLCVSIIRRKSRRPYRYSR